MKLNFIERLITGNPVRSLVQRRVEGPWLRRMGTRSVYPVCLEIGCGGGTGAEVIARRFGAERVVAIDIDPRQIERARRNMNRDLEGRVAFRVGDAMAIDEPSGKFDAVFSFGVLHHMEDWRKAVREAARVLKSGGEFFFEEPQRPFLRNVFVRLCTRHPAGGEFDFEEFKAGLEENQIETSRVRRLGRICVFGVGRKAERHAPDAPGGGQG
jgi:SAM-dependent methyltransferase